jgi:F-type H+-transporting ATPase subunit c
MLLISAKFIGGGLATISLAGAGVGIGNIFAGYIRAVGANPKMEKALFAYTVVGFALTEAIALFGLMMAFLIIYS